MSFEVHGLSTVEAVLLNVSSTRITSLLPRRRILLKLLDVYIKKFPAYRQKFIDSLENKSLREMN